MHPDDVAFLAAKGVQPVTAEIAIEDSLLIGPKQARHAKDGNALTQQEWEKLPRAISNPDAVLYDKQDGHLLYVLGWDDPKMKLAVTPDFQLKRPKSTLNAVRTAFKVSTQVLRDRKRYEVVRGDVK